MSRLTDLSKNKVFKYFNEICTIPHGSENMEAISEYCANFAEKHSLKYVKDKANNIIIYKKGSLGYENADPVILQGHLDMVCQKTDDCSIDFLHDSLKLSAEGDFLKAEKTSLGADNGIAVAMILSVLDDESIAHPPIEAVFTTDEEIGMLGAIQLDMNLLKARKMINLDSEDDDVLTVSCAGGSDFSVTVPVKKEIKQGNKITLTLKGLKGGHSGVEINKGRVNANILAGRLLNQLKNSVDFEIVSIDGGDKGNAIPNSCKVCFLVDDADKVILYAEKYLKILKTEILTREPDFEYDFSTEKNVEIGVVGKAIRDKLIYFLLCAPNGVVEMSADIDGLVETSLNLGILQTNTENIDILFTLRSNKGSALEFLEEKLKTFSTCISNKTEVSGYYPPWEFKENSSLQELYKACYQEQNKTSPKVEAIHAGLECGVFASNLPELDCISIGPQIYDVHTVNERISISSVKKTYELLLQILKKCK